MTVVLVSQDESVKSVTQITDIIDRIEETIVVINKEFDFVTVTVKRSTKTKDDM